jgi:predicted lipid-binding transport protein (Tim44 family)
VLFRSGGLLGGWLGSMFFPHWGMGYGGGFGGVLGSVFSWLLIIGLGWMVFRFFARRMAPALSGAAGAMPYGGLGSGMGLGLGSTASRGAPLAIAHVDYEAFETVLKHVQGAWSTGDLGNLRHFVTPEMLSYFADQLAENESQGVVNHVEQVEMLRGDLREAWDEGRLQYATCMLHWRALDYTVRNGRSPGDPDAIVSGDRQNPSEAAELWTFARSPGGQWLLSAIQQV